MGRFAIQQYQPESQRSLTTNPAIDLRRPKQRGTSTLRSQYLLTDSQRYAVSNGRFPPSRLRRNQQLFQLFRELDIEKAVTTTRFTAGGVTYTREAFTSFPDQLLIIRLTASEKGKLSFTARYSTPYQENITKSISSRKELQMDGKANDHEGIEGKVQFTALTRIERNGGHMESVSDTFERFSGHCLIYLCSL